MSLLFRILFELGLLLGVTGAALYGLYAGFKNLTEQPGAIEAGDEPKQLTERPPLEKANEIAARIRDAIRRERDSGGELAADFEREVSQILEERLPRIIENRKRLDEYLSRLDKAAIRSEPEKAARQLENASDPELRAVLEKNLRLARERAENLERLEILREKTEAQIKLIILGLGDLEDKVQSLLLVDGDSRAALSALDTVREEVDLIEHEYKEMETRYGG